MKLFLHPRAPLVAGTAVVFLIALYLALARPSPGPLAAPHAQVQGLSTPTACVQCHHEEGLERGCLSCHTEIESQRTRQKGYHHYLASRGKRDCRICHAEHLGNTFQLVNRISWEIDPATFAHPQVEFHLDGAHETLKCTDCHRAEFGDRFALPRFPDLERETTFLGLTQRCCSCHRKDFQQAPDHTPLGLPRDCTRCHSSNAWKPTHFEHPFPLSSPHDTSCATCHDAANFEAFTCFHCHAHSRAKTDEKHKEQAGYAYTPRDCVDCHPQGKR